MFQVSESETRNNMSDGFEYEELKKSAIFIDHLVCYSGRKNARFIQRLDKVLITETLCARPISRRIGRHRL